MRGPTLKESIEFNLAQARKIMARADYDSLPDYVKAWCETTVRLYGEKQ